MPSAICSNLDQSKILSSGNGFISSILSAEARTLYHTIKTLNDPEKGSFRKPCGQWRKCWSPAFSHFPTKFLPYQRQKLSF